MIYYIIDFLGGIDLSIYNDLKDNIDENGYLSYKFDLANYCKEKINASYNYGGADAFYVFSNQFDNEYREDKHIINLFEEFKDDYDIEKFYNKLDKFLEDREDFLLIYNIDYINEYFINNKKDIRPENIYKLSKYIINRSSNIEMLKLGIFLLSQFDLGNKDKKIILDLALCDEFTFYTLFYGIVKFDNSNEIIFDLIKKVFGIGRLFLIDQLKVDSNEKREYLVLNTNIDSISSIGVGRVLGEKVNIINYLKSDVNDLIYRGLSNIVNSILFSEYKKFNNYLELFSTYIDNFYKHSSVSNCYFVLTNIYNYIDDDEIKNKVYNLVSSRKFKNIMIDHINNSDDVNLLYEITYLLCNIDSFGLDKYIYKRFITNSYKYTFMLDLLIENDKYREDSLKVLYDNFRFCDGDISNSYNEFSIESLKNKYLLNIIENYPYCNYDFINRSLFSKYVDIRNNTLNTLYTWNRESDIDIKETSIYDKLIELKDKETSNEIKNSICKLIDIDEKYNKKDKLILDNYLKLDYDSIYDLDDDIISFNDRRQLVYSCIKKDNLFIIYFLGNNNEIYRIDTDIDRDGHINSIKCNDDNRDLDKLFVLYYIKYNYYR